MWAARKRDAMEAAARFRTCRIRGVRWIGKNWATSLPWWACRSRMIVMFNQVKGHLDRVQSENNERFNTLQPEINTLESENNQRFDDSDRRFDQLIDALRAIEGRTPRLEEKASLGTNVVE